MKGSRGYGIVGLVVVLVAAVALLPWVRNTLAPSMAEGFLDQDLSCTKVACDEGNFCMKGVCHKSYPNITNNYFPPSKLV
jgi:hypothetical protein